MLEALATLATTLFTGAALYVSLVEQPARLLCPTPCALAQWRPSYRRATRLQASLALTGCLLALGAWLGGAGPAWLAAGLLLGSVVPFTLLVIMPTNRRLQDESLDPADPSARVLLQRWGRLHHARSLASLAALLILLFAAGR